MPCISLSEFITQYMDPIRDAISNLNLPEPDSDPTSGNWISEAMYNSWNTLLNTYPYRNISPTTSNIPLNINNLAILATNGSMYVGTNNSSAMSAIENMLITVGKDVILFGQTNCNCYSACITSGTNYIPGTSLLPSSSQLGGSINVGTIDIGSYYDWVFWPLSQQQICGKQDLSLPGTDSTQLPVIQNLNGNTSWCPLATLYKYRKPFEVTSVTPGTTDCVSNALLYWLDGNYNTNFDGVLGLTNQSWIITISPDQTDLQWLQNVSKFLCGNSNVLRNPTDAGFIGNAAYNTAAYRNSDTGNFDEIEYQFTEEACVPETGSGTCSDPADPCIITSTTRTETLSNPPKYNVLAIQDDLNGVYINGIDLNEIGSQFLITERTQQCVATSYKITQCSCPYNTCESEGAYDDYETYTFNTQVDIFKIPLSWFLIKQCSNMCLFSLDTLKTSLQSFSNSWSAYPNRYNFNDSGVQSCDIIYLNGDTGSDLLGAATLSNNTGTIYYYTTSVDENGCEYSVTHTSTVELGTIDNTCNTVNVGDTFTLFL